MFLLYNSAALVASEVNKLVLIFYYGSTRQHMIRTRFLLVETPKL